MQYHTISVLTTICDYVSSQQKEISDASMQATESHCCCTSSASHNKIMAGMLEDGRWNGQMADRMVEWRLKRLRGLLSFNVAKIGYWRNSRMAEWQNGGMAEWGNGRMGGMA